MSSSTDPTAKLFVLPVSTSAMAIERFSLSISEEAILGQQAKLLASLEDGLVLLQTEIAQLQVKILASPKLSPLSLEMERLTVSVEKYRVAVLDAQNHVMEKVSMRQEP